MKKFESIKQLQSNQIDDLILELRNQLIVVNPKFISPIVCKNGDITIITEMLHGVETQRIVNFCDKYSFNWYIQPSLLNDVRIVITIYCPADLY